MVETRVNNIIHLQERSNIDSHCFAVCKDGVVHVNKKVIACIKKQKAPLYRHIPHHMRAVFKKHDVDFAFISLMPSRELFIGHRWLFPSWPETRPDTGICWRIPSAIRGDALANFMEDMDFLERIRIVAYETIEVVDCKKEMRFRKMFSPSAVKAMEWIDEAICSRFTANQEAMAKIVDADTFFMEQHELVRQWQDKSVKMTSGQLHALLLERSLKEKRHIAGLENLPHVNLLTAWRLFVMGIATPQMAADLLDIMIDMDQFRAFVKKTIQDGTHDLDDFKALTCYRANFEPAGDLLFFEATMAMSESVIKARFSGQIDISG
jgi:hypothetical protein